LLVKVCTTFSPAYTFPDLGTSRDGPCSEALAVNHAGDGVGYSIPDGQRSDERPFLYRDAAMTRHYLDRGQWLGCRERIY
jgi:hypothetical protein